jgi:hypothetical protein
MGRKAGARCSYAALLLAVSITGFISLIEYLVVKGVDVG